MYYILLSDGRLGKITEVCDCEDCKLRGQLEFKVSTFEGAYLDCIKYRDLFNTKYVIMIAPDFESLASGRNELVLMRSISDLLASEMLDHQDTA